MISSIIKTANRSVALRSSAALVPVELAQVGQHASDGFGRPVGSCDGTVKRRGCRPHFRTRIPARTNTAALRRGSKRPCTHLPIGFVLTILLAYEKLIFTYTYACDSIPLLAEKVFGPRVAFVRQQFARICRSSRASGATSGRREPNLSLRRMQLPLRESPPRNGARRLPWCPEQARTR